MFTVSGMLHHLQNRNFAFLIASFILLFVSMPSHSQFYERGQDPAFIQWKQIRTENFQIIFPESYLSEAQRLANFLEYAYNYVSFSLKNKPRKISVIIHNYTVQFNGFVSWAPKRMELYPTSSQNIYPQDALEQLALHELRHVVQVDKLHQGLTRILYYVFGEMATGVISGMLPIWYLEGDAVATETALSRSGRGRLPSFEMKLRTLSQEKGGVYRYDKAYLGSYKDYVPDYYQYGYQMIAYSRQKYGSRWWDQSLNFVARNPYLISPIHFSLYNHLGLNKRRLYDATFRELGHQWSDCAGKLHYTSFDTLNIRSRDLYTSYRFPQYLNDSVIIAEKSSLDKIPRFVALNRNGEETVIHKPGFHDPVRLSVSNNTILWTEIIPDVRWSNREFSVIKKFDITSRQETPLTRETRYFSPAFSPDGTNISTIEVTIQNQESLLILNTENGTVIREITIPAKTHAMMPTWSNDGKCIYLILLTASGKSIQKIDLDSETWEVMLEPGFEDILTIAPSLNYLFFHSTYSGIDNLYAIEMASKKIFQVTSSRNGAFDVTVSPDGQRIAFSDYSSSGYNIAEMDLTDPEFIALEKVTKTGNNWHEVLASQEADVITTSDVPEKQFEVTPYRKLSHFLNVHSWAPFYTDLNQIDLENFQIHPGLMLLSQNKLSTVISSIGYAYKDARHQFFSTLTFKGLFPVIDLSMNYGGVPLVSPDSLGVSSSDLSVNSRIYIPLNLTRDRYVRGLVPSFETEYRNFYIFNDESKLYEKGLWTNSYRLYGYNYLKLAYRDFLPKWGQTIDLRYASNRFSGKEQGSIYSLRMTFYLPGLMTNHSLKLSAGIEKRNNVKRMFYYNSLDFPRGYSSSIVLPLAENLQSISGEYSLPIWYPDINISSIIYFKRLRGSLFYDYSHAKIFNTESFDFNKDYDMFTSTGGSLVMDLHFLRIRFPISLGVEYAYLPMLNRNEFSMIFNINVFGFNINN